MDYREELGAALARIANLERELKQAESGQSVELAPLRDSIARLEGELERTRAELSARTRAAEQQIRHVLHAAKPDQPTLVEHNRSFPPVVGGTPVGVLCPRCREVGDAVQMVVDAPLSMLRGAKEGAVEHSSTLCPRCLYLQVYRTK